MLTCDLNEGIRRLTERTGAAGATTLIEGVNRRYFAQLVGALTIGSRTSAAAVILETGGDRESVTTGDVFNEHAKQRHPGMAHGEIRLMSALEPQPGHDEFFKVISTKVQFSPLNLQFPVEGM